MRSGVCQSVEKRKELKTAYARVVNTEYRSIADLENSIKNWSARGMQKTMGFPDAVSRTAIRTGPNTVMLIAIYETEELAEKAREIVNQYTSKSGHFHEIIDFHGEVVHQE